MVRRTPAVAVSLCLSMALSVYAGPLVQYDFEGNVNDSSGNNNNGTVSGSASYVAGFTGQALSLDGSSWIVMPNGIIHDNPNFTVSFRFKTAGSGGILGYQNQLAETLPTQYVPVLTIVTAEDPANAGKLRAELWTTAGGLTVYSASVVNDNAWHKVVISASTTSISVYLDNAFIGQQFGNVNHLSMIYNQIGTAKVRLSGGDVYRRYTGLIDDFTFTTEYLATVSTAAVSGITSTSATGNGSVTDPGYPNATQHGVCWNTSGTPTIADSKTQDGAVSSTGAFTSSITGLTAGVTYYVRAYATNSAGTAYGGQVSLTPTAAPTVTTAAVTNLGTTTASCGGNVTSDGGDAGTTRGVCWSTSANPTTADSKTTDGSGAGAFVSSITGLAPATTYHVRAYAQNSAGTSYGADVQFTTGIAVTTSGGTAGYAIGGAVAVVDPNLTISATTITDFKVSITGNFAAGDTLAYTGALPGGVSASYSAGTGILTFTGAATAADWQALLRTVTFSSVAASALTRTISFTAGSAIPYSGNGHFYEYVASGNIQWATALTAAGNRTLHGLQGYLATITSQAENDFIRQKLGADAWIGASDELVEGEWRWKCGPEAGTQFSSGSVAVNGQFANWNAAEPNNVGGIENYAEIYCTDNVGKWNDLNGMAVLSGYVVEYGGMAGDPAPQITAGRDVAIVTLPTVTTAAVTNVTVTTVSCGGNVTATGGGTVTACGVCWNITGSPTIADSLTTDGTNVGTGAYASSIAGLAPGTTYYVRAYATNPAGTAYGVERSFTSSSAITASGGNSSYTKWSPPATVDAGLTVQAGNVTGMIVSITSGLASGDLLAYTGVLPGGVSASYDGNKGILTFTGTATAAQWQTLLRTVTFSTTSSSSTTRTIAFTMGTALPFSGNGHFYEFVPDAGSNWTVAEGLAQARILYGLQGYLATITSASEQDFITQKVTGVAWIGATDDFARINAALGSAVYANQAASEGNWYWVTGPEKGTQITSSNFPVTVVNSAYVDWNDSEPNNSGGIEHYAQMMDWTTPPGRWNDIPDAGGAGQYAKQGYVVEYGGMPGDPVVQISAARNVAVAIPTPPTISTLAISQITSMSACSGGTITADGGAPVTVRGICWNTTGLPTTADNKTTDGAGTGVFSSSLAGLSRAAVYYVRAYATNVAGTAYGNEVSFVTGAVSPTIATAAVTDVTATTAQCGGNVLDEGGSPVTQRGVCWNTIGSPTIADRSTSDGAGTGAFSSSLTGLTPGTTYHVRAYAVSLRGAAYGAEVTVQTLVPQYTVSFVAGAGGSITGVATQIIPQGGDASAVTAVAAAGSHFADWTGTNGFVSTDNPLMITNVAADMSITANFAADPVVEVTVTPEDGTGGAQTGDVVQVGQNVSFLVNVSNTGGGNANNVVATIPLPENTEFVSGELVGLSTAEDIPGSVTCQDGQIIIRAPSLPAGMTLGVRLVLRALQSGSIVLAPEVTTTEKPQPTPGDPAKVDAQDDTYKIVRIFQPLGFCGQTGMLPLMMTFVGLGLLKRRTAG